MSEQTYFDQDGNKRSLDWMVRNEPEWTASCFRAAAARQAELVAEVERLGKIRTALKASMDYFAKKFDEQEQEVERLRERAAVAVWRHLMGCCKKRGVSPSVFNDFFDAADKVRALSTHPEQESSDD